jgi:hypothetical protein
MSNEGKSSLGFRIVSKTSIILILTFIPSEIVLWLLYSAVLVDGFIRELALLLSVACFLVGSTACVSFKPTKKSMLLWGSGFIVAIGIILINCMLFLVLLALTYPVEVTLCSTALGFIVVYMYLTYITPKGGKTPKTLDNWTSEVFSLSRLQLSNKLLIGGFELNEIPESHLQLAKADPSHPRRYRKFLDILRALTLAEIPLALRIERTEGKTRVFYLTWAKQESILAERIVRLEDALRGNLSGMRFLACPRFEGVRLDETQKRAVSILSGEPLSIENDEQGEDALTVAVKVLQSMPNGIIQISSTPKHSNNRQLRKLEEKYCAEVQRSEQVVSIPKTGLLSGDAQESTTRVDSKAQRKAISLRKKIDRMSQSHLCEVHVNVLCWDSDGACAEESTRRLMNTLRGNLVPADREHALTIVTHSRVMETAQLLRGEPIGKATLLSLEEAIVYFIIPFCDLGIPVVDHAAFHSNPSSLHIPEQLTHRVAKMKKPTLKIGKVVDDSGQLIGDFEIIIDDLASHSLMLGDTGTGKTTTQLCVLDGLQSCNISYLVTLASKNDDYLRHLGAKKDVYIFTIGDETTAPARFSLTGFHEGVHVNSIIDYIKTVFVAAKPCEGMIKDYLETLVELTFKRMGWDRDTNTRGLPLIPRDFLETLPLMEEELLYSSRGNEDFWGALHGRVKSLCTGPLSRIFGTVTGISVAKLAEKRCILLMDKISKDERSFFLYWLISNFALHFDAEKRMGTESNIGLKYYIVLEETHQFLPSEQGVKQDEGHGAQVAAIRTISTAVKESRSAGLGFSFLTQNASQLNSEIYTTVMNIFMHRKNAKSERELIGDQMNCNDEQITMMGALPTGQAVVRTASSSKPVRVQIDSPFDPASSNRPVTDAYIRKHMEPMFKANPHFQEYQEFTRLEPDIDAVDRSVLVADVDISSMMRAYIITKHPTFRGIQRVLTEVTRNGSSLLAAHIIRAIARLATDSETALPLCCLRLLRSHSSCDGAMSEEVLDSIIGDLVELVPSNKSILTANLEVLHERLDIECAKRVQSAKIDEEEIGALISKAVKDAIAEFKNRPRQSSPAPALPFNLESDLSRTIEGVVTTDEFAEKYLERVEKAIAGDISPLVRLIKVFSKNLLGPDCTLAEVSSSLLHHARSAHKTPEDDAVWNRVFMEVQSQIIEQGSEIAT